MCLKPWFKEDIQKTIPCGGCLGCRKDKVTLWQARAESEMVKTRNAFITLTYDNAHLTYGKDGYTPTLNRKEIHKFLDALRHTVKRMKTLPKNCTKDYKYYLVAEYGAERARPHAHILLFGLDFQTMKSTIQKQWKNGQIQCERVCIQTIKYCMNYMMKNLNGKTAKEVYDAKGIERPFIMVSKRFGKEFFENHKEEINRTGGIIKIGSRLITVPTYYTTTLQSYKKEDVEARRTLKAENHKKKLEKIKRMGFDSLQNYLNTTRRAREKALERKSQDKGLPIDPKFKLDEIPSDNILSEDIQNIIKEIKRNNDL